MTEYLVASIGACADSSGRNFARRDLAVDRPIGSLSGATPRGFTSRIAPRFGLHASRDHRNGTQNRETRREWSRTLVADATSVRFVAGKAAFER